MTDHLDKQRILNELEARIASLTTAGSRMAAAPHIAEELANMKRAIDAGNYDVELTRDNSDLDDLSVPVQDPLEAAADRILGSSGFMDTVREIPVGDVVRVQTILYRRADEHEKQAAVIRERRAQMTEALQGLLSPEKQAEESTHAYAKMDEVRREEYYAATGLRDRNGGR